MQLNEMELFALKAAQREYSAAQANLQMVMARLGLDMSKPYMVEEGAVVRLVEVEERVDQPVDEGAAEQGAEEEVDPLHQA